MVGGWIDGMDRWSKAGGLKVRGLESGYRALSLVLRFVLFETIVGFVLLGGAWIPMLGIAALGLVGLGRAGKWGIVGARVG